MPALSLQILASEYVPEPRPQFSGGQEVAGTGIQFEGAGQRQGSHPFDPVLSLFREGAADRDFSRASLPEIVEEDENPILRQSVRSGEYILIHIFAVLEKVE